MVETVFVFDKKNSSNRVIYIGDGATEFVNSRKNLNRLLKLLFTYPSRSSNSGSKTQ